MLVPSRVHSVKATRVAVLTAALGSLLLLAGTANADCIGDIAGSGQATYYDYVPGSGACSFVGDDSDAMVAAMNPTDYAGAKMCGRYLRVTGPLGSVDVRIVDLCPGCGPGAMDMNAAAFAVIQNIALGTASVTWKTIPDPTTGSVSYKISGATNPFFLQVQPRHHRYGVQELEYLGPSGYVTAPRSIDNFFNVDASLGVPVPLSSPFTVRVTDVNGQQIVQSGIPIVAGSVHAGTSQFPVCTPLDVPRSGRGGSLVLRAAAPNPFRDATSFTFELPVEGDATLRVYDAAGRRVRTVVSSRLPAGPHQATWDGRSDAGRRVAAGLYFCRLECGDAVEQQTVVRGE